MKELKAFLKQNKADSIPVQSDNVPVEHIEKFIIEEYPTLHSVIKELGGRSFEQGAFRFHTFNSSAIWSNLLRSYFTEFNNNFYCFGYDWMGCMYGYSLDEEPTVFIFDPADMDTREAVTNVEDFFNIDLVKYKEDTLLTGKFNSVKKLLHINSLEYDKCLGYKVPLFLGGEDKEDNFDKWDLEVYWEIQHKIYEQIKDLPEGTQIGEIKIED